MFQEEEGRIEAAGIAQGSVTWGAVAYLVYTGESVKLGLQLSQAETDLSDFPLVFLGASAHVRNRLQHKQYNTDRWTVSQSVTQTDRHRQTVCATH